MAMRIEMRGLLARFSVLGGRLIRFVVSVNKNSRKITKYEYNYGLL